ADIFSTLHDFSEGLKENFWRFVLGQISSRPGFEKSQSELIFRMCAQNENRKLGPLAPQFLQNLQSSFAGHGDIEYDDIPALFSGKLQSFVPVVGFSNSVHVALLR